MEREKVKVLVAGNNSLLGMSLIRSLEDKGYEVISNLGNEEDVAKSLEELLKDNPTHMIVLSSDDKNLIDTARGKGFKGRIGLWTALASEYAQLEDYDLIPKGFDSYDDIKRFLNS